MKFSYLEIPREPTAAFPDIKRTWHPVVEIQLEHADRRSRPFYALVDTGCQFCIFPGTVARLLEVAVQDGRTEEIAGIGDGRITGYFHTMRIIVGDVVLRSCVALTKEETQIPILGHIGFLEHFRAVFDWEKKELTLHHGPGGR